MPAAATVHFKQTAPVLRIFDTRKAREFYVDFLGFSVDWEHRFGDNFPLYLQVSRAGLVLHLSEHHGDGSPGAAVFVSMAGIAAFQQELAAKAYTYCKPSLQPLDWGQEMTVTDPFGNRLRFCEQSDA